jgi:hypothetical protein
MTYPSLIRIILSLLYLHLKKLHLKGTTVIEREAFQEQLKARKFLDRKTEHIKNWMAKAALFLAPVLFYCDM